MSGHIGLGFQGAIREYMLNNTDLMSKSPANQFAAKLATGAGNYDDLQNWSYWVMDDWTVGIGQRDAQAGGSLYSQLETRYPNEFRIPKSLTMSYHIGTSGGYSDYTRGHGGDNYVPTDVLQVGTAHAVMEVSRKIYYSYSHSPSNSRTYVKLLLKRDNTYTEVAVSLYSDSAGKPGTILATSYLTITPGVGYGEFVAAIDYPTTNTYYHITVRPRAFGATLTFPISTTDVADVFHTRNLTTWTATLDNAFIHEITARGTTNYQNLFTTYFSAYGSLVIANEKNLVVPDTSIFGVTVGSALATTTDTITALLNLGDILLVAQGASNNAKQISSTGSVSSIGVAAELLAQWNGYVYRSVGNQVWYTADLITWDGPIDICASGWSVRGMAGLGDHLYCSTDDGLYYIGYGDGVFKISNWGSVDDTNGKGMIHYQGSLVIPVGESIMRWDGNSMMPMGLDRGEGLPANRSGTVAAIVCQNNWLYVGINSTSSTGSDTIWAWDGNGWHFIAAMPEKPYGPSILSMTYRRDKKRIHIGTDHGAIYTIYAPDVAKEPADAPNSGGYMPYGYIDTDWFFGGLLEVQKDVESVYITGDNISDDQYIEVYWQDDDSTDWEYLGTVEENRKELRWSVYADRPNTRQLKLRLVAYTKDVNVTPVIRAVRLKYHPMVADWFRWQFPIICNDKKQMADGSVSTYTADQMRAHLDSLITSVQPFIFRDLDGKYYECKVMGATIQHIDVEWIDGGLNFQSIYNMAIEQIRSGEYTV